MAEIGPEHPIEYRQEVVAPLYGHVRAAGSAAVIGTSSMGKSRLIHFMTRPDVIEHYASEAKDHLAFIWVDHHRLADVSEWGFYELMLTALVEWLPQSNQDLQTEIIQLRDKTIENKNPLVARRNVELAVHRLCDLGLQLCFLLDEFDEIYRELPPTALTNLRALRDRFKYRLSYVLFMRDRPDRLRDPRDHEGFYELFSRNLLGLQPYQAADANRIIAQIEERKAVSLSATVRKQILALSGGHPGLIVTLISLAKKKGESAWSDWEGWLQNEDTVHEECLKIWLGLNEDERLCLQEIAQGLTATSKSVVGNLTLKGLVSGGSAGGGFFSPLFAGFVKSHDDSAELGVLTVDDAYNVVKIGRREIGNLTASEFKLISYLASRNGEVCNREDILKNLYPNEDSEVVVNDNRIDSLVRHVRKKIESGGNKPKYLLTVHGVGYQLVVGS